jgi:hypothetical protein
MKNKLKHYKNQTNLEIMLGTETSPQHRTRMLNGELPQGEEGGGSSSNGDSAVGGSRCAICLSLCPW